MENREHKFRGQDDSGKWHYGSLITMYDNDGKLCYFIFKGDKSELQNIEPWDDFILVKPESVGEYSGLKDHSSEPKEIYEGDIIETSNLYVTPALEMVGVVTFRRGQFLLCTDKGLITENLIDACQFHNATVIGNITDNHELLDKIE